MHQHEISVTIYLAMNFIFSYELVYSYIHYSHASLLTWLIYTQYKLKNNHTYNIAYCIAAYSRAYKLHYGYIYIYIASS